jgi:hypothetical protein
MGISSKADDTPVYRLLGQNERNFSVQGAKFSKDELYITTVV